MKQFYKLFAVVAMIAAMAACDGQIPEIPTPSPTPNGEILFSITATPAGGFTKATDTAFEIGDAVGVFGFKADLSVWLDNGKFTKTESGFESDKEYYWYEGEEVGRIIGIYPYNADYSSEKLGTEGVEFCVKSDQRTHAGYTASDLMSAVREVAPTKESVVLEFNHLLSKIVIDINNQTSKEIAEVMVSGVKGGYTFSLTGDALSGGEGTIKAGKLATASEGYTDTYVLIIPPQTVAPKLVMTTADQKQYTYNATEEVEFGMGKVRHIMATITEESISTEFDAIVNDWSADEDVEFSQSGDNENPDQPEDPVVGDMTVNPLWSAVYVPELYDEESGKIFKDLIHMVSTDENNGFFFEVLSEEYYQAIVVPDVYGYVKNTADYLVQNLEEFNATNGTDLDFTAYTYYKYGLYDMHWIMGPGKWRAVMWGMTTEGEVTGLYYISDMVEVIDPATPEYLAWLGTYTLKDSEDLTWDITISRNVVNESFALDGLDYPLTLPFNPTGGEFGTGSVDFNSELLISDLSIGDMHFDKFVFGGVLTTERGDNMYLGEGYALAIMSWWSEEPGYMAVINPYGYQLGSGETAEVTNAGYFLENSDGIYQYSENLISFPAFILSKTEEESASMVARKPNPLEYGNNGAAKRLDEVRKEIVQPIGNYVVGGRKFNAINF